MKLSINYKASLHEISLQFDSGSWTVLLKIGLENFVSWHCHVSSFPIQTITNFFVMAYLGQQWLHVSSLKGDHFVKFYKRNLFSNICRETQTQSCKCHLPSSRVPDLTGTFSIIHWLATTYDTDTSTVSRCWPVLHRYIVVLLLQLYL